MRVTIPSALSAPRPVVVLVDDDPAVAHAVEFAFGLEGLDVRGYRDGESLLASCDLPPRGCLVLDYKLPGVDGLELLALLRQRGVRMPAVLITTNPRPLLQLEAAAAGVPIVEKPLLSDALLTTVRNALAHSS